MEMLIFYLGTEILNTDRYDQFEKYRHGLMPPRYFLRLKVERKYAD